MYHKSIINLKPISFMWETTDPFLFCVHHLDHYPEGNEIMGPKASLQGRNLGHDFTPRQGWRMYHGERIPGFPAHPHRGFETVTVVQRGFVDHSDSHGAAGRYGQGDVQWMTAGAGLQHSEMFPLINTESENTLELFQIWINLPKAKKFAPPHFAMLWSEKIPTYKTNDENCRKIEADLVAGQIGTLKAPAPAPDSWAANPDNEVAIWPVRMEANARWTLPNASPGIKRTLYFYQGEQLTIDGYELNEPLMAELLADQEVVLEAGNTETRLLILQGKPIAEPVAQYGPFVMNTQDEISQAISDYRATQFGGWPWNDADNVHPRNIGRFAKYKDGQEEKP